MADLKMARSDPSLHDRQRHRSDRREFIAHVGRMAVGLGLRPALAAWLTGAEAAQNRAPGGKARRITIHHTSDIHAQLAIHDEFFWENGKPAFKRRGGFATLRTITSTL